MKKVQNFVAGLARNRKSTAEIKKTTRAVYGDKAWRMASIYYVIMMVKAGETTENQRNLHARKTKKSADIVAAVAAKVKEDWRITCKDITSDHGGVK